jgi:hypothetical protein
LIPVAGSAEYLRSGIIVLTVISLSFTTSGRCANRGLEPGGQNAIGGIGFQLRRRHPLEQIVEVQSFSPLDPLATAIDLRVGRHGTDHGCSIYIDLARLLDDFLQGGANVALAAAETSAGACRYTPSRLTP